MFRGGGNKEHTPFIQGLYFFWVSIRAFLLCDWNGPSDSDITDNVSPVLYSAQGQMADCVCQSGIPLLVGRKLLSERV